MTTTNRRPGKFEGCTDQDLGERLQDCASDTSFLEEELGDVQDFGWYALLINPFNKGVEDERHYIVSEDGQGFFDYTEFETKTMARRAWRDIEREYDEFIGDTDDEN